MISPFSFMKISTILISHMHGDHVFGLPCLLQTMGMSGRTIPLTVYGPPGISKFIDDSMVSTEGEVPYPLDVVEVIGGEEFDDGYFRIQVYPTDHGIQSVGFVIREPDFPGKIDIDKARALGMTESSKLALIKKGQIVDGIGPEDIMSPPMPGLSLSYSGDTKPSQSTLEYSRGVDVLIHESTYMDTESELAESHNHTTSLDAAKIARDACARYLMLTHISNRYDDRREVEQEARSVFPESYAVDDMRHYEVTRRGLTVRNDV